MDAHELLTREETPGKLPKTAKVHQKRAQDEIAPEDKMQGDDPNISESAEDKQWKAVRELSQVYYQQVTSAAMEIKGVIDSGEIKDYEMFDERLHEYVDGHRQVFMTGLAKITLLASDNADAYEEEMGEPAPSVESGAYFAFQADILQRLEAEYEGKDMYTVFEEKAAESGETEDEDMFENEEENEVGGNPY